MPVRLISLEDGSSILLDKPILLLGRHQECDVQIESRKISRRHCCIAHVDNSIVIRDLESTNGIKVNGVRVQEARLCIGDEVILGNLPFRVAVDDRDARPAPVSPAKRKPQAIPQNQGDQTFDQDQLLESSEVPVALDEPLSRQTRQPEQSHFTLQEEQSSDPEVLPFPSQQPNKPGNSS